MDYLFISLSEECRTCVFISLTEGGVACVFIRFSDSGMCLSAMPTSPLYQLQEMVWDLSHSERSVSVKD